MKEFLITLNGKTYEVQVEEVGDGSWNTPNVVPIPVPRTAAPIPNPSAPKPEVKPAASGTAGKTTVKSPMPGVILKMNVAVGDAVKSGTVLCVLEAMKMENEIMANEDGVIVSVNTSKGANVNTGDILITID
jgi:biotin carboxyl carrier protein